MLVLPRSLNLSVINAKSSVELELNWINAFPELTFSSQNLSKISIASSQALIESASLFYLSSKLLSSRSIISSWFVISVERVPKAYEE